MPAPIASPVGNDAHAQPTSKVPAFFAPSLCCSTTEVAGRDVVGRVGAEDDEVDLLGLASGALERLPRRRQRDVGGGPVLGRLPAAADPARRLHLVDELGQPRRRSAPAARRWSPRARGGSARWRRCSRIGHVVPSPSSCGGRPRSLTSPGRASARSGPQDDAAVHRDHRAVDERRRVGGEPDVGVGDVLGLAPCGRSACAPPSPRAPSRASPRGSRWR